MGVIGKSNMHSLQPRLVTPCLHLNSKINSTCQRSKAALGYMSEGVSGPEGAEK